VDIEDMESQLESIELQFLEEEVIIQEQIQRLQAQMTHIIDDNHNQDGIYPGEEKPSSLFNR
jgi:hypothetical protein